MTSLSNLVYLEEYTALKEETRCLETLPHSPLLWPLDFDSVEKVIVEDFR